MYALVGTAAAPAALCAHVKAKGGREVEGGRGPGGPGNPRSVDGRKDAGKAKRRATSDSVMTANTPGLGLMV